jgi:hypothetical protein
MDNVPVHVNQGSNAGRRPIESPSLSHRPKHRKGPKKVVLFSIATVLAIAVIVLAGLTMYRSNVGTLIDSSKYQAVFFTNGQVYFGKLETLQSGYMRLTDIFYLQTKATDSDNPQETSSESSDVELIKLGDEIHGPSDEMIINNDQVLFFENLKLDGKVSQSIKAFQNKQ